MEPKIKNGSFFIVSDIPFKLNPPRMGDIVLFKNNEINIVKRIVKIEKDKFYLAGDNKLDSKIFKPIKRQDILGKVIWVF